MSATAHTYKTEWLGQPALALETSALRFVTVPTMGAKIVSLFDKRTQHEWLIPPVNRAFKPAAYGSSFVDQDMSGWDEMFPTIDACAYPVDGQYKGHLLPDHGEVWAIPWEIDHMANTSIRLSANGRSLPYHLTRQVEVVDDHHFHLTFEVTNTGTEPITALWAAHPQFAVNEETRIRLPRTATQVVNVHPTPDWGKVGNVYPWAEAQSQRGEMQQLDQVGTADLKNCRKFYLPENNPVDWAALQQGDNGTWLRLSWNTQQVPYLGIWVDEGAYNSTSTVALEPSTGYYDKLDFAWENQRSMHLIPNQPVQWMLDIAVGNGDLY